MVTDPEKPASDMTVREYMAIHICACLLAAENVDIVSAPELAVEAASNLVENLNAGEQEEVE